jgi:hypothetical protein
MPASCDRFPIVVVPHIMPASRISPLTNISAIIVGLLVLGSAVPATAQTNVLDSDPIRARKKLVYDMVGAYFGPSFNGQTGTIVTDCNCEFTGGAQTGLTAGLMFERLTRSSLRWGVTLGYELRSVEGQFTEIEGVVQQSPSTGQQYVVPIQFSNVATTSLGYLSAMPYLKYDILDIWFVRGGAVLSYVISSNLTHVKTLETDTVTFPNGETAAVSLPGAESGSVELQNGPIPELNPFQLGLSLATGVEIRLSKTLYLSPVAQYIFPLTQVSSFGGGFSVQAFQIFLEGRFIL